MRQAVFAVAFLLVAAAAGHAQTTNPATATLAATGDGSLPVSAITGSDPNASVTITTTPQGTLNTSTVTRLPAGVSPAALTSGRVAAGLDFADFGVWTQAPLAPNQLFLAGGLATGVATPPGAVPTTGSATYVGLTQGAGFVGGTPVLINGRAVVIAIFGAQSVLTSLSQLVTQSSPSFNLSDALSNGTITGNTFQGPLHGGIEGELRGQFFGPKAQEVAGVWRGSAGPHSTLVGAFGAR